MGFSQFLVAGANQPVVTKGGRFFGRKLVLHLGDIQVSGLRADLHVVKTLKPEPNTLDLKVYNLSADTRKKLQGRGVPIIVEAGYESNSGIIFSGDSRTIDHEHNGPDVITRVRCGDGERVYQFSRFAQSFAPGTSIADVIRAAARATTLGLGNLEDALKLPFREGRTSFVHGYTAAGFAVDSLNSLLKSAGFTWSIQQGQIQVLQGGKPVSPTAVLLTPDSGLIGSPQYGSPDKKGAASVLKVRSLMLPQLRCGGVIALKTETINGQFRIEKLEHEGDSAGQDWYTDLEVKAI